MNRTAQQILQEEFLITRAKLIEVAAVLDRIDLASRDASQGDLAAKQGGKAEVTANPKWELIQSALSILKDDQVDKAKRIQELMSRPYDPDWRDKFQLSSK